MDYLEFILVICLVSLPSSLEHQNLPPGVPPQQYAQGSGQPQYQQHAPQHQTGEYQRVAPGVAPAQYQQQQPNQYSPQQQQQQFQAPPQQQQQFQAPQQQQQQFQAPQQQQQQFQAPQQHQGTGGHGHAQQGQQVLHSENIKQEREHIKDHLDVPLDTAGMSDEELQFHYFKMHDADNNNVLDGQELLKSLFHWHDSTHQHQANKDAPQPPPKIFTDEELRNMIDPIMDQDDKNWDGYIDYSEFISAQKKAAMSTPSSTPPQ